jgi:hypothetical protein
VGLALSPVVVHDCHHAGDSSHCEDEWQPADNDGHNSKDHRSGGGTVPGPGLLTGLLSRLLSVLMNGRAGSRAEWVDVTIAIG